MGATLQISPETVSRRTLPVGEQGDLSRSRSVMTRDGRRHKAAHRADTRNDRAIAPVREFVRQRAYVDIKSRPMLREKLVDTTVHEFGQVTEIAAVAQ